MTQIKKVSFRETFGACFEVGVIATEDEIKYRCSKTGCFGRKGTEVTTKNFACGHDTWWDLVTAYNHNMWYDWQEQGVNYVNNFMARNPACLRNTRKWSFWRRGLF